MKNTRVTLVPLTEDDREQFILDNQRAFKYEATEEFGECGPDEGPDEMFHFVKVMK